MQIHLISVGNRMPPWVNMGFEEYAKRLPRECGLVSKEIPLATRNKNSDIARLIREEGERMLAAVPAGGHVVALDVIGQSWSTTDLADKMRRWLDHGRPVALMIGGPDGLSPAVKAKASEFWSLSALTFPHPMVRIIVAEQLYRAFSILQNHPYHRA